MKQARLRIVVLLIAALLALAGGWYLHGHQVLGRNSGLLADYALVGEPIRIAEIHNNASGLAFNPETGTLFVVVNGPPTIVELEADGRTRRVIRLEGFDDTEGIAHLRGSQFAVTEEKRGNVVLIDIDSETRVIHYDEAAVVHVLPAEADNRGLEAIDYDAVHDVLYFANESGPQRVYCMTGLLDDAAPSRAEPLWTDAQQAAFGLANVAGLACLPGGEQWLLLSRQSRRVVQCDAAGHVRGRFSLKAGSGGLNRLLRRAEGMEFADGTLYLCREPNFLYILRPRS